MMNRNKITIKHITGIFKDLPEFPTPEDLSYLISRWFYEDGGKLWTQNHTSVEDLTNPVFTNQLVSELTDKGPTETLPVINRMVEKGILTIVKETQHNKYYRFETNDYK